MWAHGHGSTPCQQNHPRGRLHYSEKPRYVVIAHVMQQYHQGYAEENVSIADATICRKLTVR
ncbi:hypothetical protein U9M48_014631 [Paspalum notatum var. saurae]|uniref:Uncharacterized protein n=1 Tax=Paspalum notatum var. saurae TaxID=547442 RepID=A0AAQ3T4S5_PASNO